MSQSITILSGINLQIRNLDMDDAGKCRLYVHYAVFILKIFLLGNYICEVESEAEPIKQTNTLQILGKIYNIRDCFKPKKKLNKR